MDHLFGSVGMLNHGVTFNLSSPKMYSPCFSYHKDISISAPDYYVLFVILPPLTTILQLISFTAS